MNKRKPTILSQQVEGDSLTLTLKVDADIYDFSGHFTHFPLLPGVTQIDWVLYYAQQLLKLSHQFAGMEVIKFQQPIFPDSEVTLVLNWDNTRQKLAFQYSSGEDCVHSAGKVKLSNNPL